MLARRLPGILPPLTFDEALDVTQIHSVAGLLKDKGSLVGDRRFSQSSPFGIGAFFGRWRQFSASG